VYSNKKGKKLPKIHILGDSSCGSKSNLSKISKGMNSIEKAKKNTLIAIENISAISEETASASEEVG